MKRPLNGPRGSECPNGCGHSWWPVGDDSYACNAPAQALREAALDLVAAYDEAVFDPDQYSGTLGPLIENLRKGLNEEDDGGTGQGSPRTG